MTDIHASRILILDFGSQYTQLIARRVREIGVYSEIRAWDMPAQEIEAFAPSGIILSGGPESVTAADAPRAPGCLFSGSWPLLGICYGMQTLAAQLGGAVQRSATSEFGYPRIRSSGTDALLHDIRDHLSEDGQGLLDVWMSHGDKVTALPEEFDVVGRDGRLPHRGHGASEQALVRYSVSPGGHAYAAGQTDPRALRARYLRLRGAVDASAYRRRRHRSRA